MPSPGSQYLDDEIPRRADGVLTPRRRWQVVLAGALVGALIGPSGFLLQMRLNTYRATGRDLVTFPGPPSRWARNLEGLVSTAGMRVFLLCAFLATLALMPLLIRWLESQVHRSRRSYYTAAAIGGVFFGIGATFFVAWGLSVAALIAGVSTGTGGDTATGVAALAGGALVFGPLVGLFAPFFFILPIAGFGVPFGLGWGAVIRRLTRETRHITA
jgi:hypothetical protein